MAEREEEQKKDENEREEDANLKFQRFVEKRNYK